MSLIRARQRRKREWIDVKKGPPPWKLAVLFVLVLAVTWYLGRAF